MIDLFNEEINLRSRQIYNTRKQLSHFKRKKKIYENLLKTSQVSFISDNDLLNDGYIALL